MEEKAVMTVEEAATLLRLSKSGTYSAIKQGLIPCVRIGRRILVARAAIDQMLSASAQSAQHG